MDDPQSEIALENSVVLRGLIYYQSEILLEGVRDDSLFGSGVVQEVDIRRLFTSGTSRTEIEDKKASVFIIFKYKIFNLRTYISNLLPRLSMKRLYVVL